MKTWFITGASSGLGEAFARAALDSGERVIGTFRSQETRERFAALAPGRAFGVLLDVRDEAAMRRTIDETERDIGAIDVLINNAGYGLEGALEELTLEQVRDQFEVNVFGLVALTQAVLPHMRGRRAGHILNVASIGGLTAFPGISVYNASKFAVVGLSEGLAKEVRHLGIKVTVIEPGAFRTDWSGRSMVHAQRTIDDYAESAGARRATMASYSGRQAGDPAKAAQAVLKAVNAPNPPFNLLLGTDALRLAGDKLGATQAEICAWAPVTVSTDFADAPPRENF